MDPKRLDVDKLNAKEKSDLAEIIQEIVNLEDQRDAKAHEMNKTKIEHDEIIAGYKETITDFDIEIHRRWNAVKTGQFELELETVQ